MTEDSTMSLKVSDTGSLSKLISMDGLTSGRLFF